MVRYDLKLFLELNEEYRSKPLVPAPPKYDPASLLDRAVKKAAYIDKKVSARGRRVLEIGCGRGEVRRALAEHFECAVVGVDVSTYKEWANPVPNVQFFQRDLSQKPSDDLGVFDLIYSNSVWEHLRHPFSMLKAAHSLLADDGDRLLSANLYRGPKASHRYREVFFPWPHLLFSDDVFHDFYTHLAREPEGEGWVGEGTLEPTYKPAAKKVKGAAWINQLSIADYFLYFKLVGFELVDVRYSITHIDKAFYQRFADKLERFPLSRDMENCPLDDTRNCPLLVIGESRDERGANHRKPFVGRSTGAGDEDAGRSRGDGAAEGVRLGYQADRTRVGLQPSHGEALCGGRWPGAVQVAAAREDTRRARGLAA